MKEPITTPPSPLRPEAFDNEGDWRERADLDAARPGMKEFGDELIKRGLSLPSASVGAQGYASNRTLPPDIRALPMRLQTVYRIAYNNALAAGRMPEQAKAAAVQAARTLRRSES